MRIGAYIPTKMTCMTSTLGIGSCLWTLKKAENDKTPEALYCLIPGLISIINLKKQSTYLNILSVTLLVAKFAFDNWSATPNPNPPINNDSDVVFDGPKTLSEIGQDTLRLTQNGTYTKGKELFARTEFLDIELPKKQEANNHPSVEVISQDCLTVAQRETTQQDNPTLLVMFASPEEPGGGFLESNNGQEEDVCRRSEMGGLMNFLNNLLVKTPDAFAKTPPDDYKGEIYSLYTKLMYTPNVRVFREKDYKILETPFEIGVLSSAAVVNPELTDKGNYKIDGFMKMKKRIFDHLRKADELKYTTLVTGAFGCGAFNNPPEQVAELYESAMNSSNFKYLKKVIFAITPDNNGSLEAFQKQFNTT